MAVYYISQFPWPSIKVEIEGDPPCLMCGEPVLRPSMGGPLVCGPCDCGNNRDGSRWTEEQNAERQRHLREQVWRYQGNPGPPPEPEPWPTGIVIGNLTPFSLAKAEDMVTFKTDPTRMEYILGRTPKETK